MNTNPATVPLNAPQSTVPRVLIADDTPEARDMLHVLLRDAPFQVELAADGYQTLRLVEAARIERRPYDLVVLDAAMPGLSGLQVAEFIRADAPDAPLAFLTAYHEPLLEGRARMVNAVGVWRKPADLLALQSLICKALNL